MDLKSAGRSDLSGRQWIDVSVPLRSGMTRWPGDDGIKIEIMHDMERGDRNNLSSLSMGSHTGTHVDAPLHFIRQGTSIDSMPLDACVGRARIIEIRDRESIKPAELAPHRIRRGERILFKTHNSSWAWQTDKFAEDFVFISKEAASYLVERGVRLVGVDYLSVGRYRGGDQEVHQKLLGAGIWCIEGLDLSKVGPGNYDLICLALRVAGAESAPARAIVRHVE